jgi:hypothetical protein
MAIAFVQYHKDKKHFRTIRTLSNNCTIVIDGEYSTQYVGNKDSVIY